MDTCMKFQNGWSGTNIPLPVNSTVTAGNTTSTCVSVIKFLIFTDYVLIICLFWFHNYSAWTFPIEFNQSVYDGSIRI